jgi:hypothetical protein
MSTITCPHAETARSTAATYDPPGGKSRNSEVCDTNARQIAWPASPATAALPPPVASAGRVQRDTEDPLDGCASSEPLWQRGQGYVEW